MLLNDLSLQEKTYPLRESNRKFMTLPYHIEHWSTSIRERLDFTTMFFEVIFEKLRTYVTEQEQRSNIYGHGSVDNKNSTIVKISTLVAHEPETPIVKGETS